MSGFLRSTASGSISNWCLLPLDLGCSANTMSSKMFLPLRLHQHVMPARPHQRGGVVHRLLKIDGAHGFTFQPLRNDVGVFLVQGIQFVGAIGVSHQFADEVDVFSVLDHIPACDDDHRNTKNLHLLSGILPFSISWKDHYVRLEGHNFLIIGRALILSGNGVFAKARPVIGQLVGALPNAHQDLSSAHCAEEFGVVLVEHHRSFDRHIEGHFASQVVGDCDLPSKRGKRRCQSTEKWRVPFATFSSS